MLKHKLLVVRKSAKYRVQPKSHGKQQLERDRQGVRVNPWEAHVLLARFSRLLLCLSALRECAALVKDDVEEDQCDVNGTKAACQLLARSCKYLLLKKFFQHPMAALSCAGSCWFCTCQLATLSPQKQIRNSTNIAIESELFLRKRKKDCVHVSHPALKTVVLNCPAQAGPNGLNGDRSIGSAALPARNVGQFSSRLQRALLAF